MKKMAIKCKLCGIQYKKQSKISFHIFPKDPVLRKRWIEACKLHKFSNRHPDKLLELRICSKHFDANSYVPYNTTGIARLRPDAVPRLGKPNKQKQQNSILKFQTIYISGQDIKDIPEPSSNNQSSHDIKDLNVIAKVFVKEEEDKLDLCNKNTEQCIPIITNKVVITEENDKLDLCDENAEQCIPIVTNEVVISEDKYKLDLCNENAEQCIPVVMNEVVISEEKDKLDLCNEVAEQCIPIVINEVVISEEKDKLDLCDENAEQFIPIVMNEVVISEEKDKLDLCDENAEQFIPIVMNEVVISEEKDKLDLCDENAEQCIPVITNEVVISEEKDKLDLCDENAEQCTSIVEQTTDNVDIEEDALPVIKKRKIWRPANVVQLTEEHFETPKDRELHLSLIKRKFDERKKMIKSLQRQKNQLIKKITIFSDVLNKLKDKKLIKEDVAKMLLMYYNTIFQIKSFKKH